MKSNNSFVRRLMQAALAGLVFTSAVAGATTITFDGHGNDIYGDESIGNGLNHQTLAGYDFSSSGDHFHFINMAGSGGASNGTSSLLEDRGYSITMSKVGGGSFNLLSFLDYSYNGTSLSVTGNLVGGGTVNELFTLSNSFTARNFTSFNNLTSVVFQGAGGNAGFGLENVQVSDAAVPEPASLALFGVALAAMAFRRRKQS
jgi:hypothetical protein